MKLYAASFYNPNGSDMSNLTSTVVAKVQALLRMTYDIANVKSTQTCSFKHGLGIP